MRSKKQAYKKYFFENIKREKVKIYPQNKRKK
jgi:hypothetical protein